MPTALITGPTAGIGAAYAKRLASDGYSLVLASRDQTRLDGLAAELSAMHGITTEVLVADLSTQEGISAVEKRLQGEPVDLLINNAGFGQPGTYLNVPIEAELNMLTVHVEAVLRLTSAAIPGMRERGSGQIINVASVGAFVPRGTYGASKAWVVSFTQGIAADLAGSGVKLQVLCPGFVRTEFHERAQMNVSGIAGSLWLDADDVVAESLSKLASGPIVVITGRRYRALVRAAKVLPASLLARVSAKGGREYK